MFLLFESAIGVISTFTSNLSTDGFGILSDKGNGGEDKFGTIKSSLISKGGEKLGTIKSSATLSVFVDEYKLEALSKDDPSWTLLLFSESENVSLKLNTIKNPIIHFFVSLLQTLTMIMIFVIAFFRAVRIGSHIIFSCCSTFRHICIINFSGISPS